MSTAESRAAERELAELVYREGEVIGGKMDEILPFNFSFFERMFKTRRNSEMLILPTRTKDEFRRLWLTRHATKDPLDSKIYLLSDEVSYNPYRERQADQTGFRPTAVAFFNPRSNHMGLKMLDCISLDIEKKDDEDFSLTRVRAIGGYVTQIALAELTYDLAAADIADTKEFKELDVNGN